MAKFNLIYRSYIVIQAAERFVISKFIKKLGEIKDIWLVINFHYPRRFTNLEPSNKALGTL